MADTINNGKHKMMGDGENHRITNFTWPDATARTSATYTEFDIYKEGVQVDTDPPTFWRIISVTSGVAEFIQFGGGGVVKTGFFGIKIHDSIDHTNSGVIDIAFYTATGKKIPVTALSAVLSGNTILTPLADALDNDTGTAFSVDSPASFPYIIYASSTGFNAEDVAEVAIYKGFGDYGTPSVFEFVASENASAWTVIDKFVDTVIDGEWHRYKVNSQKQIVPIELTVPGVALTTGSIGKAFHVPFNCRLVDLMFGVVTPSSSGNVDLDITVNSSSIFTTRVTIDASENSSVSSAVPYVLIDAPTPLLKGDRIEFNIIAAGTGAEQASVSLVIRE